jgi:hypothetical protein
VIPLDPVGTIVIVVSVDEPLALARVVELAPLLAVVRPLPLVKAVVVRDPLCPTVLDKTVEPVPVVPILERVVCVEPVVPETLKRKTFISKRRLYY